MSAAASGALDGKMWTRLLRIALDLAYPALVGLTPKTAMASSPQDALEISSGMTYPLFVKGAVQSLKGSGWQACVASDRAELSLLVQRILKSGPKSRGKVVIREFLALRHHRKSGLGFPIGREYRVFIFEGQIISSGYYWDCEDEIGVPNAEEQQAIESLALKTASKLQVPFVAIDLGQDTDLNWWVIETADAQFAGIRPESVVKHWSRLHSVASGAKNPSQS